MLNIRHILLAPAVILIFSTLMLYAGMTQAGRYRQPAYVTNAYFTNQLIQRDGIVQPQHIINVLRSDFDLTRGYFVVDLIMDKGSHKIEMELLDSNGKRFDGHTFDAVKAPRNDFSISINLDFGGQLPDGGIFLKLHDHLPDHNKHLLGTFRIFTENWK